MTPDPILAAVFGLTAIAAFFVVICWGPVLANGEAEKYKTIASGMLVANIGVCILCINRALVALGYGRVDDVFLLVAGATLLAGKTIWLLGCEMGKSRRWLVLAAALATAYLAFVGWRFL